MPIADENPTQTTSRDITAAELAEVDHLQAVRFSPRAGVREGTEAFRRLQALGLTLLPRLTRAYLALRSIVGLEYKHSDTDCLGQNCIECRLGWSLTEALKEIERLQGEQLARDDADQRRAAALRAATSFVRFHALALPPCFVPKDEVVAMALRARQGSADDLTRLLALVEAAENPRE